MAKRAETPERWSTEADSRRLAAEPGQHLQQVVAHLGHQDGLLPQQGDLVGELGQVVGADLRAEPVLERGDDPAAVGVVLRVGGGDQEHVQRQPQRVAADLDVALLQHVEQGHLDPLGQVGQLVQAEDPAVGPRHQTVVHGLRVAEGAALSDLDRVDVADQVADRGVRRGQLLGVAVVAVPPGDRQVVAELGGQRPAADADRGVRVVVDLAAGDLGAPLVEQRRPGCASAGSCPGRARRAGPGRGRPAGRSPARAARCRRSRRCRERRPAVAAAAAAGWSRSSSFVVRDVVPGGAELTDGRRFRMRGWAP